MTRLATGLSILFATGCGSDPETTTLESPVVDAEPAGTASLPDPKHVRGWRRMSVDQLDASIRQVTGGIGWDDSRGTSEFENLAATLGVPDYIDATTEDLAPTLLFQKFLDDAAIDVCNKLVAREKVAVSGKVLLRDVTLLDTAENNPEGIESALSRALYRFHGRRIPVGDPQLEPWRFLFESATLVAGGTEGAWRTVCVGLLTHPDFYTY